MPPVVIQNHSIILPNCQKPPTQRLQWKVQIVSGLLNMYKWTEQCQDRRSRYLCSADGYLVVNFKFLNHSKFQEHPQGCSNHGIHIKWEVIKMDIINAKLWHQRDVCCLKMPKGKGNFRFKTQVFFSSYKKPSIHHFWPANTSPAWFKCRAIKVFNWEIQTCQANRAGKQWEGEERGMSRKYAQHPDWSLYIAFRLWALTTLQLLQ